MKKVQGEEKGLHRTRIGMKKEKGGFLDKPRQRQMASANEENRQERRGEIRRIGKQGARGEKKRGGKRKDLK